MQIGVVEVPGDLLVQGLVCMCVCVWRACVFGDRNNDDGIQVA